jgi:glycosyltransferase involved in cell wall biosynthesis
MAPGRKTLALTLNITDDWIGGTYYIMNLIRALNLLEDHQKPHIIILSPESHALEFTSKETSYPYLSFIRTIYPFTHVKGIVNRLLKKKIFTKKIKTSIDVLYPASPSLLVTNVKKKFFWVPDFQERFFPAFFSEADLQNRKDQQEFIATNADHLVLSSEAAKKDFEKFYPLHKCRVDVLPFAVSNPNIDQINAEAVLTKYGVQRGYFFIANQFWIHKNHIVILEAIKKLKEEGSFYHFVFSGKTNDYRTAGHFEMLQNNVKEWGIENQVKFLGFIDRMDQLVLMKNADCIIQPSLFEGWGTVIEDAKSLQQRIIASDIEVHVEQLREYPHSLFEKNNSTDLAVKIKMMKGSVQTPVTYDYGQDKNRFAKNILRVLLTDN